VAQDVRVSSLERCVAESVWVCVCVCVFVCVCGSSRGTLQVLVCVGVWVKGRVCREVVCVCVRVSVCVSELVWV